MMKNGYIGNTYRTSGCMWEIDATNTIDKTGLKRTYQITIIEYNQDFLHTVVWTSSSNFTLQKSVIESVPSSLLSQITN